MLMGVPPFTQLVLLLLEGVSRATRGLRPLQLLQRVWREVCIPAAGASWK